MKKIQMLLGIIILAVCITVGIVVASVNKQNKEAAPEYVFYYAENQPENYPTSLGAHYFADNVYEKTQGRIQILVKTSGELGEEKDIITQLSYGGIDFARVSMSQLAEKIPEMNALQLPYIYKDSSHMWRVLDGEIGEYFMSLTQMNDIVGLSWYDAGARNFYSTKPIYSIEDMAGMKVRVQESQLMADMVSAIGGIPMKISYEVVYSSLEQGIVDAAENNWSSYMFMNHDEVAGFFTVDEHTRVPELQLCSSSTWNLLSSEDQQIIMECAKESALYERELWKEQEAACKEEALESGVTMIALTREQKQQFQDAMAEVYEKYAGDEKDIISKIINY